MNFIGSSTIENFYVGTNLVQAIYFGVNSIWPIIEDGPASYTFPTFYEESEEADTIRFYINGVLKHSQAATGVIGTPINWTATGLNHYTEYSAELIAVNESGESNPSYGEFEFLTVPELPPVGITVDALGDDTMYIQWDLSDGYTKIYRDNTLITTLSTGIIAYEDTGLEPETIYTYKLKSSSPQPDIYSVAQSALDTTFSESVSGITDEAELSPPWEPEWEVDSQWTVVDGDTLTYNSTGIGAPVVESVLSGVNANDPFSGNVVVQFDLTFSNSINFIEYMDIGCMVRGVNLKPWPSTSDYMVVIECGYGGQSVRLDRHDSGSGATIVPKITSYIQTDVVYRVRFNILDSDIKVEIQRLSDNLYIQPDGSYDTTQVNVIEFTDATLTGAGQVGFLGYAAGGGSSTIDNILITESI